MKFKEFKYERPSYEQVKSELVVLIESIKVADSAVTQLALVDQVNEIRNTLSTMSNVASIRHTIDTTDTFYEKEQDYWDEYSPLYEELSSMFYKVLVDSPYKKELEEKLSAQFFNIAKFSLKSFSQEIIEDLQEENRLASKYTKLLASAKIMFDGEERNLSGLGKYVLSEDRDVRASASSAKYNFFETHEEEIDTIYDELVKVRTRMAKKLGYNNFVELGYVRMMRSDYNPEMVKNFRKQVREYIVPVATSLYERQTNRLNLEELRYYDEKFEFTSGNATPKGDPDWIIENGIKMYDELSKETSEFFHFMVDNELLDLVTKKGKAGGGYCTYIPDYKSPFIFSNFNGTSGDIDVLTHEAGHAFQCYESRWITSPELNFPTYESAEIHSMSMEFFTWPWMELFFKEDTMKYKYEHLGSAIKFIPYGITVDAFQHFVYYNPELTPAERKFGWRELERQYLPHKNYDDCDFLERGGWWFQQGHIFSSPFYYIDYTLAQICALQFWKRMHDNKQEAWDDYVRLCKAGGTKSFLDLVDYANLKSPFEDGCISSIISEIKTWLESVEDTKL